jgi:hypothetical protein
MYIAVNELMYLVMVLCGNPLSRHLSFAFGMLNHLSILFLILNVSRPLLWGFVPIL